MNLYDTDGDFDPERAAEEMRRIGGVTNEAILKRDLLRIQVAALVDIAASLQSLALESELAMRGTLDPGDDDEREQDPSPDDSPLEPGDAVALAQLVEDDVELDSGEVGIVIDTGVTEGEQWVTIEYVNGGARPERRVWARQYRRVLKPDAGRPADPEAWRELGEDMDRQESALDAELDPDARDQVDDIDADFHGDEHPAAEDALAALKAKEKTAKKGKGKK